MRILALTHVFPWPARNGVRMRAANVLRALTRAGEVELFSIVSTRDARDIDVAAELARQPILRAETAVRPSTSYALRRRLAWLVASSLPYQVGTRDYSAVRSAFLGWARPRYDLVWIEHAETFVALHDLVQGPCIVDLDDLEDHKVRGRLAAERSDGARSRRSWQPATLGKRLGSNLQGRTDVRRWRELQRRVSASVEAVAVCSTLDRARLGAPNCAVVPNTYPPPPSPLGRIAVGKPPTLLLPGALSYTPNVDAARYLVREILPLITRRIPDIRVRLVGQHDGRIQQLQSEGVDLTGEVPDMGAELARADAVVVPLRFGGGTRIKILEAFAHRIPVVSTTTGCEGLDVIAGRHLLVADDPDDFASACVDLMTNLALRRDVVDAAHQTYQHRYRSDVVAEAIIQLVGAVAEGSAPTREIDPHPVG